MQMCERKERFKNDKLTLQLWQLKLKPDRSLASELVQEWQHCAESCKNKHCSHARQEKRLGRGAVLCPKLNVGYWPKNVPMACVSHLFLDLERHQYSILTG